MTQQPYGYGQPQQQVVDPLAGAESIPSVSFKDKPIGSVVTLDVRTTGDIAPTRNFETGDLEFWPAREGEERQPKKSAVYKGTIVRDDTGKFQPGEEASVWAVIRGSQLYSALAAAQKAAGVQIGAENGGLLHIKFEREEPNKNNPRLNPQKIYLCVYQPHPAADPLAEQQAPQAQPAPQAAPAPQQNPVQHYQQAAMQQPQQQYAPAPQQTPAPQFQQPPAQPAPAPAPQQAPAPAAGDPFAAPQAQAAPQAPQAAPQPAPQAAPAQGDPWSAQPAPAAPGDPFAGQPPF